MAECDRRIQAQVQVQRPLQAESKRKPNPIQTVPDATYEKRDANKALTALWQGTGRIHRKRERGPVLLRYCCSHRGPMSEGPRTEQKVESSENHSRGAAGRPVRIASLTGDGVGSGRRAGQGQGLAAR